MWSGSFHHLSCGAEVINHEAKFSFLCLQQFSGGVEMEHWLEMS